MPTLLLIIVYLSLTSLPVVADAQTRQAALAAVMKVPPAEQQARLVEGSKKESGLVWYSSTTAEDALALIKKFNEQHPSIQIAMDTEPYNWFVVFVALFGTARRQGGGTGLHEKTRGPANTRGAKTIHSSAS